MHKNNKQVKNCILLNAKEIDYTIIVHLKMKLPYRLGFTLGVVEGNYVHHIVVVSECSKRIGANL